MTASIVDLAGRWDYSLGGGGPWRPVDLPRSWWLAGIEGTGPVLFRRSFSFPAEWAGEQVRVEFDGVDYDAHVELDGASLGRHQGGFAPFGFVVPVTPGEHVLTVDVDVPEDEFGTAFPHTKQALRGVFGHHDARPGGWGPRGQEQCSGGIWGGIRLRRLEALTLDGFALRTEVSGPDATVSTTLVITNRTAEARWATVGLTFTDPCTGDRVDHFTETWLQPGVQDVPVRGVVPQAHLWWTWDHGDPHLYGVTTWIEGDEGRSVLDEREVGLRQLDLRSGWVWRLNGRRVFLRGSNYIGSQWLSELTPEKAEQDVRLALGANLNMLRVHAHVTVQAFYQACDRAGVLVWQDLPMQWGYEDSSQTYDVAHRMVRELVALHGFRPSIAIWCAHNEAPWNEPWMAEEAGNFRPEQNQRLDHELAALFRRYDPSRPSLANSGNGDGHTYPGWYWGKWTDVHELPGGAMITEYGAQAVPDEATLRTFLPEGAGAEEWSYHGFQHEENKQNVGVTYDMPVHELISRTQEYQAKLIQNSTETYRRAKNVRVNGVLQFMLTDPWACISWSVLDVRREPKLGYDALRRSMQPLLVSIEAADDHCPAGTEAAFGVWWVNDLPRPIRDARLTWQIVAEDRPGHALVSGGRTIHILADDARRALQAGPVRLPPGRYRVEAEITGPDATSLSRNHFKFEVTP